MSGPGVTFRTAEARDLPDMRRIAAACFLRERTYRAGVVDLLHFRPGVDPDLAVVAVRGSEILGFVFGSVAPGASRWTGHVDGWAVSTTAQRRGVGTGLLAEIEARLAAGGCRELRMGGTTWFYAWPGVDITYVAALLAAEAAGFVRESLIYNMDVDLRTWVPPAQGAPDVRRARPSDGPALTALIGGHFDAVWLHEVQRALQRTTPTVHVAQRGERLVGFAAHGVYQPDVFGPLGTDPAHRGSGIGIALLHACLGDMAAAGLPVAQIGWIGPADFYSAAADARLGRAFVVLHKVVGDRSSAAAELPVSPPVLRSGN